MHKFHLNIFSIYNWLKRQNFKTKLTNYRKTVAVEKMANILQHFWVFLTQLRLSFHMSSTAPHICSHEIVGTFFGSITRFERTKRKARENQNGLAYDESSVDS